MHCSNLLLNTNPNLNNFCDERSFQTSNADKIELNYKVLKKVEL